jgi:hypothetical protein
MLTVATNLRNKFFLQEISVQRRSYAIDSYGVNVLTASTAAVMLASVQPTAGRELEFLPDFALLTEAITIYTILPLYAQANSGYNDIVTYNNKAYTVIKSKEWKTHWESIAVLEPLSV